MASATILKNFKYNNNSPQLEPTFNVIETPLSFTPFAQNNPPIFKDLSFSSYLNTKDKQDSQNEANSTVDDTEISIFDAQKYFSETNESKSDPKKPTPVRQKQKEVVVLADQQESVSIQRQSSVNSSADGYGRNYRSRSYKTTPTASSEASWNSQTGLLANPPGSVGVSLKNFEACGSRRGSKIWFLSPKSCCIGKKSVQVKEEAPDNDNPGPVLIKDDASNMDSVIHKGPGPGPGKYVTASQAVRQHRVTASGRPFLDGVGPFSFPILNSNTSSKPGLKDSLKKPNVGVLEDPPRKSMEVFQAMLEFSSALRPDHNCSMMNRAKFKIPGSPVARVTNIDDDVCSDASSDLFEIESLSTPTSYPMYRRRDSMEDSAPPNFRRFTSATSVQFDTRILDEPLTPSVAATECYAPSEVSIDWSVTTAEGFDKASVANFSVSASEIGNVDLLRERMQEEGDGGRRKGNAGGLLLMGCRQEKAVSVGPQPVKCMAEGPPIFPLHMGGRPPRANKTTGGGGGSNAARLSIAFAA